MREILFRGRSIKTGEWVEGYFVIEGLSFYIFSHPKVAKGTDLGGYLDCNDKHKIDPRYIHQYTALNYKDGRKIFEGDVVKDVIRDLYAEIKYCEGGFVVDYDDAGYYVNLRDAINRLDHFGIACEPPEDFNKEWSEANEQAN